MLKQFLVLVFLFSIQVTKAYMKKKILVDKLPKPMYRQGYLSSTFSVYYRRDTVCVGLNCE